MTIKQIHIRGFRSVRDLTLPLHPLNVVSGPNGCGKSNLYKAVRLLHEAANGRLALALAEEGGVQKVMWAGGLRRGDRRHDPKRLILAVTMDDMDYQLETGFPEPLSTSLFNLDPLVKEERIWLSGQQRRPSSCIMQRTNQTAFLHNIDGERVSYAGVLHPEESLFGQLGEPHRYPELSRMRERLKAWRFYHEFAVWPGSPIRSPQIGVRAPVLAHDGSNLAAAWATIVERGHHELLYKMMKTAFPDTEFQVDVQKGRFQMLMQRQGILRPLESAEFSDGTLRFLCLVVALLSPRPPAFMALNEPENSLHEDLLPALAALIAEASQFSQLWITSHSPRLATLIAQHAEVSHIALELVNGETRIVGEARI
ncbi:MAG: Chromosome partition protein Smc [Pantoea stewartii]|uniref:AAA family ATPase n=1 Tax=Pantoea stewartii TaxID=66269 RepID=UPI0006D158F9|nr:AAA family ATPase [Pantoea stewartii]WHS97829.1 MAG: Chromosome partition protein Smc [Pantoea stewartii]